MKLLLTVVFLLAGCQYLPDSSIYSNAIPKIITPYKVEIQQGNQVTQEMLAKLRVGMTRAQVRFALGTPLIMDPFRPDRWDYLFMLYKRGDLAEQRRIVMHFKGDLLERIEGDVVAANPAPKVEPPSAEIPNPTEKP